MASRLAFLGPAGTYSEQAAIAHDPAATLVPFTSIPAVAGAVESGLADEAIVPIENSLEGSVTFTLDLLIHDSSLVIRRELVLRIHHALLARPGTRREDIEVIYSHPQALAQCRAFISKHLSKAQPVASLSTSAAVQQAVGSQVAAGAVGNRRAAKMYKAEVLAADIEDNPSNVTRFVVLAARDHPRTGTDKTSICFEFDTDGPGLLQSALGEFASRGINLGKIESRPTKLSLGRYVFLVDMDGHREDECIREVLDAVRRHVSGLKIFGSYPRNPTPVPDESAGRQ